MNPQILEKQRDLRVCENFVNEMCKNDEVSIFAYVILLCSCRSRTSSRSIRPCSKR